MAPTIVKKSRHPDKRKKLIQPDELRVPDLIDLGCDLPVKQPHTDNTTALNRPQPARPTPNNVLNRSAQC